MTQEQIDHWKVIVRAVISAETEIKDELYTLTHGNPTMSHEDMADKYCEMIAKEILSKVKNEKV